MDTSIAMLTLVDSIIEGTIELLDKEYIDYDQAWNRINNVTKAKISHQSHHTVNGEFVSSSVNSGFDFINCLKTYYFIN